MLRCLECDIDTLACEYSPNSTEGAGVIDTDFVLYVTTSNISCTDTYAYASSCSQEYALNRPIIGYVNFCPLSFLQDITDAFLITIIKHEIIHALGFAYVPHLQSRLRTVETVFFLHRFILIILI